MKAAIVLDAWKQTIFKRRIVQAGFTYEQHPGVAAGTVTLTVITDDGLRLAEVVKAANDEAARVKENKRMEN